MLSKTLCLHLPALLHAFPDVEVSSVAQVWHTQGDETWLGVMLGLNQSCSGAKDTCANLLVYSAGGSKHLVFLQL